VGELTWSRVFSVSGATYTRGLDGVFASDGDLVVAGFTDGTVDFGSVDVGMGRPLTNGGFVLRLSN
jgi:hypothetical protein